MRRAFVEEAFPDVGRRGALELGGNNGCAQRRIGELESLTQREAKHGIEAALRLRQRRRRCVVSQGIAIVPPEEMGDQVGIRRPGHVRARAANGDPNTKVGLG